jgi:hypothetical protein
MPTVIRREGNVVTTMVPGDIPVGIERGDLVSALGGFGPLQIEGLGDGLAGSDQLQGQTPEMQGCLCTRKR